MQLNTRQHPGCGRQHGPAPLVIDFKIKMIKAETIMNILAPFQPAEPASPADTAQSN
jgi:hypothetical protein